MVPQTLAGQKLAGTLWRKRFAVLGIILAIKVIFLLLDSTPSFFYGDSEAYLAVAVLKWIPPDRSFLYGLLIRRAALHFHSLHVLICLQACCSAVAAWSLFLALSVPFRIPFRIAAAFGTLCAVEPLQLMMERYIMTEAVANVLFAVHFSLLLMYLKRGRLWMLLVAEALGCIMIAIRVSFYPEFLLTSVLVPLLSPFAISCYRSLWLKTRGGRFELTRSAAWKPIVHLVLCVAVSQGLLEVYKQWYGKLIGREPAVFYENGAFLLADWAPLVELQDFPKWAHGEQILKHVTIDRKDLRNRAAHHFLAGGLWNAVTREFPNPLEANQVALGTATHAALRQPGQVAQLALQTFLSYFDRGHLKFVLLEDEGEGGHLDPAWLTWLPTKFGVQNPQSYSFTLTKRWHVAAVDWYWVILVALLAAPLLLLIVSRDRFVLAVAVVTVALLFLEGATVTVDRATPRFLTTDAWLVLLIFGIVAGEVAERVWHGPGRPAVRVAEFDAAAAR